MSLRIKSCCFLLHIRRFVLLMVAMLMIFGATACHSSNKDDSTTLRIGMALYMQDDTFISTIVQHLERVAQEAEKRHRIKINLTFVDGRSNQTVQMDQIDRFLERDYDVVCVNIVDRTAAAVIIDKAQAANTPVIFFNRQPVDEDIERWEKVFYVGAKAELSGTMQGNLVRDVWRSTREAVDRNDDSVLQYVMLEGEQGHQDALLRTRYAIDALTCAGIRVEKLASDTANWNRGQATALINQWIEEFGDSIEVVFANNDDMALGTIDAFAAAGIPMNEMPLVVGVDAIPPAIEAIMEGSLYATVRNPGEEIAEALLSLAISIKLNSDPSGVVEIENVHYVWLPYIPVTRENAEQFAR